MKQSHRNECRETLKCGQRRGRGVFLLILLFPLVWTCVLENACALSAARCGSDYAERVSVKKKELLEVYGKSIEEANSKEYVEALETCLGKLEQIFRIHVPNIEIPSGEEIVKKAEEMLEKAAERLCQSALDEVKNETRRWEILFEQTVFQHIPKNPDWAVIIRENERTNIFLQEAAQSRLREIIE